jgi:pyridoxal phosphate enzyme (YggS family)
MDYSFVRGRVDDIRGRIEEAAKRSGRNAEEVELLAVTKFHPLEAVAAAWDCGLRSFGESRVQEAEAKFPAFLAEHPSARLDMIGHLQANKAKKAVALFSRLQSVDSSELLLDLDARCRAAGLSREALLELHTGEESKEGFSSAEELCRAIELLLERGVAASMSSGDAAMPGGGLVIRGLMTMAPNLPLGEKGREAAIRASFRLLREARDGALARFGLNARARLDVLSMGMSGDYELAIEEGSTLVRIGTAIFGERAR